MVKPSNVSVRMYNVGFGDCFLLSFDYPKRRRARGRAGAEATDIDAADTDTRTRTLLVDFGSTERSARGPSLGEVADLLASHSGGRLDAVLVTHRHRDHVSGFGGADTDAVMDRLAPASVIRPWTDDPAIAADATAPSGLDGSSTRFVASLASREAWLRRLAEVPSRSDAARRARGGAVSGARQEVADVAYDQLPNRASIDRLDRWAAAAEARYVKAGDAFALDALPGVGFEILGPPTLAQVPGLAGEAFTSSEFWAGADNRGATAATGPLASALQADRQLAAACRALARPDGYGEARWLLQRLATNQLELLFEVVRAFDDALNNTSIIVLLSVGSRRLLLTGDAQIENWSHSLRQASEPTRTGRALQAALAEIDLYKVGHHGSRNATPRSLFELWRPGGVRAASRPPLVTLLSTLPGKHGRSADTAVPKQNLVDALAAHTTLVRSDDPANGAFVELAAHTTGPDGFARP